LKFSSDNLAAWQFHEKGLMDSFLKLNSMKVEGGKIAVFSFKSFGLLPLNHYNLVKYTKN